MASKRTRALNISDKVKKAVYERDRYCILCGSPQASPNAHYISRAQGGLGIAENIVMLCPNCHRRYDQTVERDIIRVFIRNYLKSRYSEWNEEKLYYRK